MESASATAPARVEPEQSICERPDGTFDVLGSARLDASSPGKDDRWRPTDVHGDQQYWQRPLGANPSAVGQSMTVPEHARGLGSCRRP